MKIAVYHNLPSGGAKRALYTQVKMLLERGHTLECWTPETSDRDYLPLSDLIPVTVVPYAPPWVAVQRIAPWFFEQFQKLCCCTNAMTSIARRAAAPINAGNFDVLLSANCRYQAAPPIARFTTIPAVFYCQEPYRAFHEAGTGNPLLMNRRTRIREEIANARAFDRVLVNSNYSKGCIDAAYGITSQVNYLGIDPEQFKPTGEPREGFILGVGAIQAHKRIELAIETIAKLPTPKPPLVWIGNMCSVGYRKRIEARAARLNVKLILKTQLPDSELISHLSRARLFLYTSRLEPFGLTPLEANACGTPVVAVREGGMLETIQGDVNGMLCDVTPASIATALDQLLSNPDLTEHLGSSARQHVVENWNWERSINELEESLRLA